EFLFFSFLQAKTQTLKMTIVSGLRIIDSNAQTGIMWWNWTLLEKAVSKIDQLMALASCIKGSLVSN
ncbi:hypothetical protein, partial [bacterium endosymbiont of Bathymodiolus sp. 5 South]|uniref:hypothetical protein n=1 Tax=bacterium endosymbiont of Bathymodiolus sp. 5 South TaxID=1181670 RepID=UPI0010B0667F